MDATAARYLAAGLACIGMGGAAIGVATVFGQYLVGALRNPSAAAGQQTTLYLGFALAEAFGIFSLLIALLLLFVIK
jgi:F-type H+-transporting ATPase subunit c